MAVQQMTTPAADDLGKLVLRVTLAALILFHGISKLLTGIDPIVGLLTRSGLPTALAYLVYVGEVLAPILMLLGLWTRAAALIIVINMTFAIALAHADDVFTLSKTGGWALELQGLYLIAAVVVALQGAGRYSLAGAAGRWN